MLLAIVVGAISLRFPTQPPQRNTRAVVCSELPSDTAALISQLRDAEAALQALERENDKSSDALATKSTLERSVMLGVAALRESGF